MSAERLRVNEIFYSVQGEGARAGRPCVFVRLTGCHLRCAWCDTEYAFYEGARLTLDEIIKRAMSYDCPLVEVTGGEPLLQPAVHPLMTRLANAGVEVLLETSGAVSIADVDPRVVRIMDLKCPASGESHRNCWDNVPLLTPRDEVKFVIADRGDYAWAREMIAAHELARRCVVWLSPAHGRCDPRELTEWLLADRLPVRLGLQLHKLIWDPQTRGV